MRWCSRPCSAGASRFASSIEQRAAAHDDPQRKLVEVLQMHAEMLTSEGFHGCPLVIAAVQAPDSDAGARACFRAQDVAPRAARAVCAARRLEVSGRPGGVARPHPRRRGCDVGRTACRPGRQTRPGGLARADRCPYAIIPACSGLHSGLSSPRRRRLLFLSVWIVVPAPDPFLYPLAVGSPEVAPVLFAAGILLVLISARHATRRSSVARLALVFAAIASLLSLVPVVQVPIALARFNRAMATDDSRAARTYARRGSRDATRAVFESRWRAAVARRVSACGERTLSDHHADLRRVMADRIARQPGLVLATFRRARIYGRGRSTIATHRNGSGLSRSSTCARRSTGSLQEAQKFGGDPSPYRAGGAIGGRAARDAPRVSGRSVVHTRRRQLLRARRSRGRLASSSAAGSGQRARHPRDVHRRHARSKARTLPPRVTDYAGSRSPRRRH